MRLRIQNEWLSTNANTCSNANHDLTELAVNGVHGNNSLLNNESELKFNKSFETNNSDTKDDTEESWQEITARLLQDLKREVQNARKQSIDNQHNDSNITLKTIEDKLNDKNIDTQIEEEFSRLANDSPAVSGTVEDINGLRTALNYVSADLRHVIQALTQQNEKFNKLKTKQLRNYFKRQLNLEQNFHPTSTPLKIDPKFNDENYWLLITTKFIENSESNFEANFMKEANSTSSLNLEQYRSLSHN